MKTIFSTLLLVVVLAAPTVAVAEQDVVDEIFVTIKRRAVARTEISSAMNVIDADTVRIQKLATDALASGIGVYLQQTTPGQGAAIVRGLKGSSVLHLVDGIRLNNAIFRAAPTQYLALVPTASIERMEIVRGTPTSLYGSDAVGGVVQVVTHVPVFDGEDRQMRGDALIAMDTAELGRTLRGTIDAGNREFAYSLSAEYQSTGNRRTGSGDRIGPSGYDARAVRVLLAATPTESESWLLDLHFLEQPETPRIDELVPGFGQTTPPSSEFEFAPNRRVFAHAQHKNAAAALGLDWQFDIAWQRIVDDRTTRDFEAVERQHESNRSDLYATTLSASGKNERASWIFGAEVYYDRVRSARNQEDIESGLTQAVPSRFPDNSTVTQAAIYGSIDREISEQQLLSAGLRFSKVEVMLPATEASADTSVNVSDVSGDLGWIYGLSDASSLVANIGFGFRAPNVFDLGTLGNRPGNRYNVPNTGLDSEQVVQIDLGIRQHSNRWDLEFVLFALQYDNRITSILTGDVTTDGRDIVQSVNAARSDIHGIEAGLDIDISDALSASVILNYTRGEQRVGSAPAGPADRIPPLNGRLRLAFDNGQSWRFDGWIKYSGAQDRLSARDIRDIRINPAGTPGWGILGVRGRWNPNQSWQLTITADNLLDKQYRTHGSGLDASGRNLSLGVHRIWQ